MVSSPSPRYISPKIDANITRMTPPSNAIVYGCNGIFLIIFDENEIDVTTISEIKPKNRPAATTWKINGISNEIL